VLGRGVRSDFTVEHSERYSFPHFRRPVMENPLGKLQKIKVLHAKRKMQVYAKPVPFKSCSFFKGKYCYSIDMNPFSTSLHTHTNFDCLLRSTVSSTVMVWLIISPAVYYSTTRMGHS
jgi:hypothetical protein